MANIVVTCAISSAGIASEPASDTGRNCLSFEEADLKRYFSDPGVMVMLSDGCTRIRAKDNELDAGEPAECVVIERIGIPESEIKRDADGSSSFELGSAIGPQINRSNTCVVRIMRRPNQAGGKFRKVE